MPAWEWAGDGMIGKLMHYDLPHKPDATDEEREFNDRVKLVRTIDRVALVGAWLLFALLVQRAWARRRAEGQMDEPMPPP
jgi:hypothetical protein